MSLEVGILAINNGCIPAVPFFYRFSTCSVEQNIDKRYDILCEGNGVEGLYLVRVWVYVNKQNLKSEQIRKYAIHEVIFKGVTGSTKCSGQNPLAKSLSVEEENKDYFD